MTARLHGLHTSRNDVFPNTAPAGNCLCMSFAIVYVHHVVWYHASPEQGTRFATHHLLNEVRITSIILIEIMPPVFYDESNIVLLSCKRTVGAQAHGDGQDHQGDCGQHERGLPRRILRPLCHTAGSES